jgi:hypothetical protein
MDEIWRKEGEYVCLIETFRYSMHIEVIGCRETKDPVL